MGPRCNSGWRKQCESFIPSPTSAVDGLPKANNTLVISDEPSGKLQGYRARCPPLKNRRGSPLADALLAHSPSLLCGNSKQPDELCIVVL